MILTSIIPRSPRRTATSATVLLLLLVTTAQSAFACWDACVKEYGGLKRWSDGHIYELQKCTETDTRGGPAVITCYYKRLTSEVPGDTDDSIEFTGLVGENQEVPVVNP